MKFCNRQIVFALASIIFVTSEGAHALELSISNQDGSVRLSEATAELTLVKAERHTGQSQNAYDDAVLDFLQLTGYPEGTVIFVFRDDVNIMKGMLPVWPQSERRMSRSAAGDSRGFQPSISIYSEPESMMSRFHSTEIWRRSADASIEYIGIIQLNAAVSPL